MGDGIRIRWRWVGALVGLVALGPIAPIGAVIGWFIGRQIERRRDKRRLIAEAEGQGEEAVSAAVMALIGKLALADGLATDREIQAFSRMFKIAPADEPRIKELWEKAYWSPYSHKAIAMQVAQAYRRRPAMLEEIFVALCDVAEADRQGMSTQERAFLEDVARIFRFRDMAFASSRGPWMRHRSERATDLDEMEKALNALVRPGGTTAGGRALDRAEATGVSLRVQIPEWRDRLANDPRARWTFMRYVSIAGAIIAYVLIFNRMRPVFLGSGLAFSAIVGFGLSVLAYYIVPRRRGPSDEFVEAARKADLDPDQIAGAVADAEARIAAIRRAAEPLGEALRFKVESICDLAMRIIGGFQRDPAALNRSRRFLGHYLVATEDLVKRYAELAGRGADSERLALVFAKFEPVLSEIEGLFKAQHDREVENEALKLDIDIDALRKTIKAEAL